MAIGLTIADIYLTVSSTVTFTLIYTRLSVVQIDVRVDAWQTLKWENQCEGGTWEKQHDKYHFKFES